MIASEFKDIDGFRLQFEESVPEAERTFYMKTFLRVDDVSKDRVHCTTCDMHVGTAPISEKIIRTHQILGVTQCNKCFAFYNSGEFGKGEDGSEYYCRWCGQGGEVFCCSTCPFVFCNKCIKDNLTQAYIKEIERNDDWSCFVCNKETLMRLRAQHWALRNFMNKQLEKIQNVNINSEEELNSMLNDDKTVCCPKKKRKQVLKPSPAPVKRPAMNGGGVTTYPGPPAKKQIIAPTKMLKVPVNTNYHLTKPGPKPTPPASFSKPRNNDEVVCTPDILGLFNNKNQSAGQRPSPTAPPPLIMRQNQRPVRPMASTSGTPNPIYHTVNGYQIDLNQASRQEIFRLPNGKLIQVRKQANSSQPAPQIRPGIQFTMQPRVQVPIRPAPPTITTTSRMMRPMAPQLRVSRPQLPQQRPAAPTTQPVASTVFTQQNGSISVARAPQPDTPFGKAKTSFEDKIINGLEICQHTINKMITLTNSSSFKTSRSFADLKELYIHLQYLFTYTSGKIKTLQDSLATNVEELAKYDKSLKEKEKPDEDELEIVEQKADVIEVLSDDESDPVPSTSTTKHVATKKTAAPHPRKESEEVVETTDIEDQIMSAIVATMQSTFNRQTENQMELLASCNYVSNDNKLLTRSAVKIERLEDTKSPVVKQFMIGIQQRRDREPQADNEEMPEAETEDEDFPPLVPEIVMDEENPANVSSESANDVEASDDTQPEQQAAEKSVNDSSDVVEIPSDDEVADETTDKVDEAEKSTENSAVEILDDSNEPNESMDVTENEEKTPEESAVELMDVDVAEKSAGDETAPLECDEKIVDENGHLEDAADNTQPGSDAEDVQHETEQAQPESSDQENTEPEIVAEENGTADDQSSTVNNEEITKMAENGIDEKDLLDTLINSLDENEPLAPIELENFP